MHARERSFDIFERWATRVTCTKDCSRARFIASERGVFYERVS